ncbi:Acyl-coenzyme A thioesterase PaaI [subsurface metagenome]
MKPSDIAEKIRGEPYAGSLGIRIDTVEDGFAVCSVTVTRDMLNFLGMVHGGLIFSLADVAFSAASNNDHFPSYALDVSGSFLKAPRVGDVVVAEARRVHATKRTGVYRIEVLSGGELIAIFNGTVFRKTD